MTTISTTKQNKTKAENERLGCLLKLPIFVILKAASICSVATSCGAVSRQHRMMTNQMFVVNGWVGGIQPIFSDRLWIWPSPQADQ